MTANDLRSALASIDMLQRDLARLLDVTERAVGMWVSGEREVPGPVAAYIRLLIHLPAAQRSAELSRLKIKDFEAMIDGMYRLDIQGYTGHGHGCIVFDKGRLYGSDGQATFDGTYTPTEVSGEALLRVTVALPPGGLTMQGTQAGVSGLRYDLEKRVNLASGKPVMLDTPIGFGSSNRMTIQLTKMRDVPG